MSDITNRQYDKDDNLIECDVLNGSAVWRRDPKGNTTVTPKEGYNAFRSMNEGDQSK